MAQGEIRSGESVAVPVSLKAGQYLRVAVEQKGIEVELILRNPDGKRVAAGGPVSQQGVAVLSAVLSVPGVYQLGVSAPMTGSAAGLYELFVEEQRPVRAGDYSRVAARKRLSEGLRARDQGNDSAKALPQLEEALRLWQEAGDVQGEVDTTNEIGVTEVNLGHQRAAREWLERALAVARQAGYVRGQADAWNNLGMAQDQPEAALAPYKRAIELWSSLGDRAEQGRSLYNLGYLFLDGLYDLGQAHRSFDEALRLRRAAGDLAGEAYALTGLGLVAESQGDPDGALGYYKRALDLGQQAGDHHLEATILSNTASLHMRRGKLQEALTLFDRSLANGGPGELSQEMKILFNLASLYFELGELDNAFARYQQVLDLQQGKPAATAFTLNSMGTILSLKGDDSKAEEHFVRALKISRDVRSRVTEALSLHNLGRLHLAQGKTRIALDELELALTLRQKLNDPGGHASTLLEIGTAQSQLDRPEAPASFQQALELAQKVGARALISRCLFRQAILDRDRGDLKAAQQKIENALKGVETVRSDVSSDVLRTSFFAAKREYYEFYVDLLMRLAARDHEAMYQAWALEASENARARGLRDLLAEGRIDVNRGIDPELKRQETALTMEIVRTEGQLRRLPAEAAAKELQGRLLALEQKQHALTEQIKMHNPRYAAVHYPTSLDARSIEQRLDEKTALLEYAVGRERTFLFVATHEGLDAYILPLGNRALTDRVGRLRRALKSVNPALRVAYLQEAADLYRDLVAPAAGRLAGKHNLLVSPDGILHLLPFEALLTDTPAAGQSYSRLPYLLRRYAIAYVPSASVLAGLREPRPAAATPERGAAKSFVAFANPLYAPQEGGNPGFQALPQSEREVTRIASLYPPSAVRLYVGREATKANVIGNPLLEGAARVHFAAHGVLNEQRPQLSGLVLARGKEADDDGFLRVADIFNLKLNADLVVLSACDTGGTQVIAEGLVGLTRAFFYAGASSLVVSLWRASDDSAPDLMADFYGHLASGKAEALRTAKLEMIAKERYAHPFHWASFILVGDPGAPR